MIGYEWALLCGLFHEIFRLASNKESVVSDWFGARDGCSLLGVSFRRSIRLLEGF